MSSEKQNLSKIYSLMRIRKIYYLVVAVFLLAACGDELMNSIPLIEIDPGFSNPGLLGVSAKTAFARPKAPSITKI